MTNLNQITYSEISTLDSVGLSEILLRLLHAEARYHQMIVREIIVPLKINVADGGEDGRIECENSNGSTYIQNTLSYFQCKATEISAAALVTELFTVDQPPIEAGGTETLELKENVLEVLSKGGQYVFFIGHDYNPRLRKTRLTALHGAIDRYNQLHGTSFQYEQVRIMEANEIAGWANHFIDIVVRIQELNKIHRLPGLQTITQLGTRKDISETPFHSSPLLDGFMEQIRLVDESPRSTLRIIGHSGLGKTRLVYEAFRNRVAYGVLYYNIFSHAQDIIGFITTYGTDYEGTLIVDNCDFNAHKELKQLTERTTGKFKLITMDFNVGEASGQGNQESYISLNQYMFKDIVKQILNDEYENKLDIAQIDQIADFAEGYPGMAVLFANARIKGSDNFSALIDDDLIFKLAFGRDWNANQKENDKFNVLKACSVFTNFLKPDSSAYDILGEGQRKQAENQRRFITDYVCRPTLASYVFEEAIDYFVRSGVMERRGHYLMVKPTPLAIRLATDWWRYADEEHLKNVFNECENVGLAIPLVDRLSQLSELSHAKRIVRSVWGPGSPFGSAEVLNTTMGSRIFRSVAQVNPESALETLQKVFGGLSTEELKAVGHGRRQVLWTLEKLVFRKSLFFDAAQLMLQFALAENEHISNNATGQFLHLFHIVLAGTEADLNERLTLIDDMLASIDEEKQRFGLRALYSALTTDMFRRDIGAEEQGEAAPLTDFYPSWAQSADYWMAVINRLISYAAGHPEDIKNIKGALARAFRIWFRDRLPFLVDRAVTGMVELDDSLWTEAISQITASVEYEHLDEEDLLLVDRLIMTLKPVSLENQFKYYVSTPVWNFSNPKGGEYVDHTGLAAAEFAQRLVEEQIDLAPLFEQMQTGEQLKSYAFGRKLGELIGTKELALQMLETLAKIDTKKQNPEIVAAYISALPEQERIALYEFILTTSGLKQLSFYFARMIDLPVPWIIRLFDLVDEGTIDISAFYQFTWGRGLAAVSDADVIAIYEKIAAYPQGPELAFQLAFEFMGKNEQRWLLLKPFFTRLVCDHNLLLRHSRDTGHIWDWIIHKLFEEDGVARFTETLTKQLLEASKDDHISSFDGHATRVFHDIVASDFKQFWHFLGAAILTHDYINLRFFMGSHNGNMPYSGLLDQADIGTLIDWCKANGELACLRIARIMPVTPAKDPTNWHPLAKAMIDEFGQSEKFLAEIGSNINSYGSVGSRVPYLRDQCALVAKLESHPIARVAKWARGFVKNKELEIRQTHAEEQAHYLNF